MKGLSKDELLAELAKIKGDLPVFLLQVDSFAGAFQVEGVEEIGGEIFITIDRYQ